MIMLTTQISRSYRGEGNRPHYFVLYGEQGIIAIEVKRTSTVRPREMSGLKAFLKDYPMARPYLLYGGPHHLYEKGIELIPLEKAIENLPDILRR
jgi:hypothetical protein